MREPELHICPKVEKDPQLTRPEQKENTTFEIKGWYSRTLLVISFVLKVKGDSCNVTSLWLAHGRISHQLFKGEGFNEEA